MKKLIFVTQSKGGAGKSVLAFLLAEKFPHAVIFDMDDATRTTTLQLAYRDPRQVSFLNSNKVIDRGLFNLFLEKTSKATKSDLFIADLGASISEQLPYYLQDVIEFLPEVLMELDLVIELYAVVGGANIYKQTMDYLESLCAAVRDKIRIRVFKNEYYEFSQEQNLSLEQFTGQHKLELIPFNISRDKNESTQNRIREVLKSGAGIEKATVFSRMYFNNAIKNLAV
jgi:adenylate kinase family enzyme